MVNILDGMYHTFCPKSVEMSAFHENEYNASVYLSMCFIAKEMLCVSDTRLHHYFDLYLSKL